MTDLKAQALSYFKCIPQKNKDKLDIKVDSEHDGVDTHLGAIADAMDEWEGKVAAELGLTKAEQAQIKTRYPNNLSLQT